MVSREELKTYVDGLNNMILEGRFIDAFEKYYHEDVQMQENQHEARLGKDANREFEKAFMESVEEVHSISLGHVAVGDDGSSMCEWEMDVSFKDGTRKHLEEVAVQEWQGDKIISEHFYYNEEG